MQGYPYGYIDIEKAVEEYNSCMEQNKKCYIYVDEEMDTVWAKSGEEMEDTCPGVYGINVYWYLNCCKKTKIPSGQKLTKEKLEEIIRLYSENW